MTRTRRWCKTPLTAGALLCVLLDGCSFTARHMMETKARTTGPNGPETPGFFGIPFERVVLDEQCRA